MLPTHEKLNLATRAWVGANQPSSDCQGASRLNTHVGRNIYRMPLPTFESFMRPCLEALDEADNALAKRALVDAVCKRLDLTDDQLAETTPGGRSTARNRCSWAITYLKQANAIDNPARGAYQLNDRGSALLASDSPIDRHALEQFEEFQAFLQRAHAGRGTRSRQDDTDSDGLSISSEDPAETLRRAAGVIRATVITDILEQLHNVDPTRFEAIVVDALRGVGYGISDEVVGQSHDGGIDGIINEDILGLDRIYVQAKRWQGSIGRPELQAFAGALQGRHATRGVFITTSTFTETAKDYATSLGGAQIVLVDGERLAGLMYDHEAGVTTAETVITRTLDTDYFRDD